ncbi:MAG: lysophospholipid acyltransferase family protein [Rudaea sp.]
MARKVSKPRQRRQSRARRPRRTLETLVEQMETTAGIAREESGDENAGEMQGAPREGETIVDTFDFDGPPAQAPAPEAPAGSNGREKKRRSRKADQSKVMPVEPDRIVMDTETGAAEEAEEQAQAESVVTEIPDATLREQLTHQLDEMIARVRALHPGYNPPPFSPRALVDLLSQNVDKLPSGFSLQILDKLRETIGTDLFDADTWKGIWYVVNSTLQYEGDILKRRVTGEYQTDEWGMDVEYRDAVRPFFEFMYKTYWRVETTGMENIPAEGPGLLVSNHSGQLPFDGAMIATGVLLEHPSNRIVRPLFATWFPTLPFLGDFMVKSGGVLATEDNGTRLLEQEQLVLVLPEGYKGAGKLFRDRYRLARFGRGGFVQMAIKTRSPLIPISVVGAEETYISLGKSNVMAKLVGFPYFPISPTFPWFGLLGFVPLPTKWYIDIGAPIATDGYKQGSENNPVLVSQLTDQIRNIIQEMIHARLAQRRSVFFK